MSSARPAGPGGIVAFVHGPVLELPRADHVVALTPDAWQTMSSLGLRPSVLDDHLERIELLADHIEYVRWQLGWLVRLDEHVGAEGALRTAALHLLTPTDSVVVAARVLLAAAASLAPREILYVGPVGNPSPDLTERGHLQFRPLDGDTPLARQILPLIATASGWEMSFVDTPDPPLPTPPVKSLRRSLRSALGSRVRRGQLRGLPRAGRPVTALAWTSGYGAATFAAEERRAERQVHVLTGSGPTARLTGTFPTLRRRPLQEAIDHRNPGHPDLRPLLDEVDDWARVPGAGRLLQQRADIFMRHVLPQVRHVAHAIEGDLRRRGVTRVVAANPDTVGEYGLLLAAQRTGIERLLLQHGDHLFPYLSWLVSETNSFDEMWVSDATVPSDLCRGAEQTGVPVPRFRSRSPRVEDLRRSMRPLTAEGAVCYVPSVMLGESDIFASGRFDDAWYHRWHLRVLDLMASHPDRRFIWKALPGADQFVDPIPEEITRRGLAHVSYEGGSLVDAINRSRQVIIDFPSTPLYDAVHLARPVIALSFERFAPLRPTAAQLFAPVLVRCQTEDEGIDAIENFLGDDPSRWVMPSEHVLPATA